MQWLIILLFKIKEKNTRMFDKKCYLQGTLSIQNHRKVYFISIFIIDFHLIPVNSAKLCIWFCFRDPFGRYSKAHVWSMLNYLMGSGARSLIIEVHYNLKITGCQLLVQGDQQCFVQAFFYSFFYNFFIPLFFSFSPLIFRLSSCILSLALFPNSSS